MRDLPGLLERRIVSSDAERVVIREMWDTSVKGCPIVTFGPPAIRAWETSFTPEEWREINKQAQ